MKSGNKAKTAVYPGTFDPFTFGHNDLVVRASCLFDEVIVAVAPNLRKSPLLALDMRLQLAQNILADYSNIKVMVFDGLLIDFARSVNAKVVVRGLRALSDFDYEFQLAGMNRTIAPDIETVFLTPDHKFQFISGTMVRDVIAMKGDATAFAAPEVILALKEALKNGA